MPKHPQWTLVTESPALADDSSPFLRQLPTPLAQAVMASNIPPVQRALIQSPTPGVLEFTTTRPVPELQDGQVLIRVAAVAISPWDWKTSLHFAVPGAGVGSDFSGTVVQLGPGAQKANPDLKIGDRVAGGSFGANPLNLQEGAFAEYIAGWADQVWRVPNDMGFADAASLGFGSMGAVALAVLHEEHLGLPGTPEHPVAGATEPPPWVLVHGGSTATGTLAIQFVKQYDPRPWQVPEGTTLAHPTER